MSEPEEEFDAFFRRVWGGLYAQAFVLTGSREVAQDLTQESLLRAWKHWARVADYDDPEGWTRRVLHNLCIQSWRRSRPRRFDPAGDAPGTVEVSDQHVLLAQAMRSLPGKQARALLLHDGIGMTISQTARDLGVPDGTVKSWLSRGRRIVALKLGTPSTEGR